MSTSPIPKTKLVILLTIILLVCPFEINAQRAGPRSGATNRRSRRRKNEEPEPLPPIHPRSRYNKFDGNQEDDYGRFSPGTASPHDYWKLPIPDRTGFIPSTPRGEGRWGGRSGQLYGNRRPRSTFS